MAARLRGRRESVTGRCTEEGRSRPGTILALRLRGLPLGDRFGGLPFLALTMFDLFKKKSDDVPAKPWTERLAAGLARSREKLTSALGTVFTRRKLDDETLDE